MTVAFSPRIHHFAVSVADLDSSSGWYHEKLGFTEEFRYEIAEMGLRAAFLVLGDIRLEIFETSSSRPGEPDERVLERYLDVRGLKHVAFAVDDIDATRADLEARGVPFVSSVMEVPHSGGERFCFFTDLDGVLIELFQAVERGGSQSGPANLTP